MIVVCELGHWQPIIPVILSLTHKDVQVLLQFLVDMLHLQIVDHDLTELRVRGHGVSILAAGKVVQTQVQSLWYGWV